MSGGHSFSSADLDAVRTATQPVIATVVSTKSTLVPVELFDKEHATDYLHEVGLYPTHNECVVYSEAKEGAVAVMAMSAKCCDALREVATHGLNFTSPLLEGDALDKGCAIHLEGNVLYVRIYDGGMLFAEAIECTNDADVLYYLATINEVYNLYNMYARASGDTKRLLPLTKRIFKDIVCE
jgi:hypothetical protein